MRNEQSEPEHGLVLLPFLFGYLSSFWGVLGVLVMVV